MFLLEALELPIAPRVQAGFQPFLSSQDVEVARCRAPTPVVTSGWWGSGGTGVAGQGGALSTYDRFQLYPHGPACQDGTTEADSRLNQHDGHRQSLGARCDPDAHRRVLRH